MANVSLKRLLDAPKSISRPLMLIDGRAYVATWEWFENLTGQQITNEQHLCIIRDDGQRFSDVEKGIVSLPMSTLGISISLHGIPDDSRLWSARGTDAYIDGKRPDAPDVFLRVRDVVNRFIDFSNSFTSQERLCELTACYIIATYFLDAFDVIGYLCANGQRGSGKTHFLHVIGELAYLGQVILSGSSYATLRDLANYGATLAFDDAEAIMQARGVDAQKRELMLAGNHRGASVTLKEQVNNQWQDRRVNAYCSKLFSAINLPEKVLASRMITISLMRSTDDERAKADPLNPDAWPHDRRQLIDDLWALALANLPNMRTYNTEAATKARLTGRNLEPWRAILAIALWLETEHGMVGLFSSLEQLSACDYQKERSDLEADDPTRLLILALDRMLQGKGYQHVLEFAPATLSSRMNALAIEQGTINAGKSFTNDKKVGRLLKQLGFKKAPRTSGHVQWKITQQALEALAKTYAIELQYSTHEVNVECPMVSTAAQSRFDVCPRCQGDAEVCQVPGLGPFEAELRRMIHRSA